jgi:ABC-2 type transport system ATP-binding protein
MEHVGLEPLRDTRFHHLSGGQKQRLFFALALIHDPELLLLDELTTGLDPQGRRMIWDRIRDLNRQGKTIVLTTHFMEEAERLCDRVLILDRGEILALDRPEILISGLSADHVVKITIKGEFHLEWFEALPSVDRAEAFKDRVTVSGRSDKLIPDVVGLLIEKKLRFYDLHTRQPNLEDVFLHLTGRQIRT